MEFGDHCDHDGLWAGLFLGDSIFVFAVVCFCFWRRQCCLFRGIIVLAAAAAFLGGGFASSICLAAALHRLLQRCLWSLFGGWCLHFGGGVLLFWQMGCCLFRGGGIMVRT